LADLQDQEVGDGTTTVVILAAELLKRANELIQKKIHPTTVISGYRLASREACKYIKDVLSTNIDNIYRESLVNAAKTSLSSKVIGIDSDFFSNLAVEAMLRVKSVNARGDVKYSVKAVNVLKCHGKSAKETLFVPGYALNCTLASQAMPRMIKNAKIALLDFNLERAKMFYGTQVTLTDPSKLDKIRERELDITKERIELMLKAGINVIITSKGIDDMLMKYFVEANAMAVRRVTKKDLKQLAKATGAKILLTMANTEAEESFDPEYIGEAEEVVQDFVSDKELIFFRGCKNTRTASIILRGPNEFSLDEMERSLHDSLCILKRTLESKTIVPGGGAVEAALSIFLETFATTLGSREQLAIAQFAEALLTIPKILAVNSGKDAIDLVAKLRALHNTAQTDPSQKALAWTGLDLKEGVVRDNLKAGVIEPSINKVKSIQFATEAAITILRIDELIKLNPKPPPNPDDDM